MRPTATLRRATAADTNLLTIIGEQSFAEAFGEANTPENMAAFLSRVFAPEIVADELATPTTEFYLAELGNEAAGYVKMEYPAPEAQVPFQNVLKISRLYLLRKFLGLGLGDQLMHFCIEKAKLVGCEAIWLTVWEHNLRAVSFYQKWGFYQVGTEDFILGDDVQLDYLLVKQL
ncbi:GNAT family N-acetyltransferase [Adhaeribacter radiodurans]|uniref:GNAT family N-acetyltransferase n=1 Tax=Adhaeribacter radiodurans TaxID=2745197 RepID=A0A7L7LG10_9BACT|nr:GNAT family N-acetyltransferase [Adhaeribacter radiodurans]QMU31339.1 GNAT family N-acetyltransferase [Adhaeribacter radiodurans]